MAGKTYRHPPRFSIGERLADAAIGGAIGVVLALGLWLFTVWVRFH
jgi:hypothetical protein